METYILGWGTAVLGVVLVLLGQVRINRANISGHHEGAFVTLARRTFILLLVPGALLIIACVFITISLVFWEAIPTLGPMVSGFVLLVLGVALKGSWEKRLPDKVVDGIFRWWLITFIIPGIVMVLVGLMVFSILNGI